MPAIESIFVAEHVEDTFANYTKGSFGLFFVLPLLVVYLRLTYQLLYEKEKKLREGMLMMGLRTRNYYASWILTYMIYFAVLSILNMSLAHFAVFKVPTTTIH
jgi:ATP-binding cassette subfamily A (ABC1) protein 3